MASEWTELFSGDPWARYYNLDRFSDFALTSDVDWAPDYCIEDLFSLVGDSDLNLSIFATHNSSILKAAPDFVEVGLHPDFTRPHPEHGIRRKMLDLLDVYPEARGVRAHRNFFGQNIAQLAREAGLIYDASVFHWSKPFSQVERDQYGLVRMTYCWEDGIQADRGLPWELQHVPIAGPGLKIFNVHPIFIYLNCPDDAYRRSVTNGISDLTRLPYAQAKAQIYRGYGARSFLIDLLKHLRSLRARSHKLADIALAGGAA
jgi:hypothetical protein